MTDETVEKLIVAINDLRDEIRELRSQIEPDQEETNPLRDGFDRLHRSSRGGFIDD